MCIKRQLFLVIKVMGINVYTKFHVLRLYFYLSCLWGGVAIFISAELVNTIIKAYDVFFIIFALISLPFFSVSSWLINKKVFTALISVFIISIYLILHTIYVGTNIFEVLSYHIAYLRFFFLLLFCLNIIQDFLKYNIEYDRIFRLLKFDFNIITFVLVMAMLVQMLLPSVGHNIIPVISKYQSGLRALEEGNYSSIFPNTIDYAFFLIVSIIFCHARVSLFYSSYGLVTLLSIFILTISVLFTGSEAALGASLLVSTFFFKGYIKREIYISCIGILAVILISWVAYESDIVQVALGNKIDNMMLSRLGLLFVVVPDVINTDPLALIFGYTPDFSNMVLVFRELPNSLDIFQYDSDKAIINDVFWFSLVMSYGIPCLLFLLYCTYNIFSEILSGHKDIISFRRVIIVVVLFIGMFNQIFMVRSFIVPLAYVLLVYSYALRRV